ncbi:MAG: phosphoenolpyruvate--protein phosphotransferase [Pseudomonadota bacterium]|nr:phosphoenolpyruvate--protein phosphotransferase [Pseudomonadota bacterium]
MSHSLPPSQLISPELIRLGATPATKADAIRQAGQLLADAGCIAPAYIDSLLAREKVANTFLGSGVAIPHGQIADRHMIHRTGIAVLQVPAGVAWNSEQTATLIFAIAAQSDEHLALLRRLTRLLQDEATLHQLTTTQNAGDILAAFDQAPPASPAAAGDLSQGFDWTMPYPNGLHARPAQQWVETARRFAASVRVRCGQETGDAKNLMALLQLGMAHGAAIHVSAEGADADAALTALRAVMDRLAAVEQAEADKAAQQQASAQAAARNAWRPAGKPLSLPAISASPGLAIGTLRVRRSADIQVPDEPSALKPAADALDAALAATRTELLQLATDTAARIGATEGGIFRAQAELLGDTGLIAQTCQHIAQGHGVAWSWHQAIEAAATQLAAVGSPLLAARAADLRDVGLRVLRKLAPHLPLPSAALQEGDNLVIAAADLTPSDTAALDLRRVAGLCTAQGGPSSHTAIIARTLGLPALVAAGSALLDLPDGETVVVDGDGGRLYWQLDEADLQSARQWRATQQAQARANAEQALQPALTQDGQRVEVAANVNRPEQVPAALAAGAEGVGLMRTEFLYLERDSAPSEDEQYDTYCGMVRALGGKPLIIRTLDIGGDKQVPYLNLPHEENPFLGIRGSRLMLRRPDLLEPQLRAIYRAAKDCAALASEGAAPLSIMFPMITSLAEITALKADCERIRQQLGAPAVPIGIMIEVPAAAAMADQLARHVDFFSIGTNDLTQYVLAIDRQHPELAREADSLHPAVLRMIQRTVQGARAADANGHPCWVGVCGGIAGDPLGAAILVGLGVRELSMSQRDIAPVKAALRGCDSALLAELAGLAVTSADATQVRALADKLQAPRQVKH